MHKDFDWWVTKEGWKAKLRKWLPDNKDLSDKVLKKQRRAWIYFELLALFLSAILAVNIPNVSHITDSFQRLATLGAFLGGMAGSLALYAQFRVLEVEVGFELRLREALAEKNDWNP